jgi:hypothetical protein
MGLESTLHNSVMFSLNSILYYNWTSLIQLPPIIIIMNVWNGICEMSQPIFNEYSKVNIS